MTDLTPQIRAWITDSLGTGAQITRADRLPGSTSTTLFALDVTQGPVRHALVLRLFDNAEWLAEEPDLAPHEAANLRKAAAIPTPTPELIAVDEDGSACGLQAVLMTRVPGSVRLVPDDLDMWLRELAAAIVPLHHVDPGDHRWTYAPYNDVAELRVPEWSAQPGLWAQAIERVQGAWPPYVERFIHRDYHPMNVLWNGERISGIVDWPNACRGPAGIDAAWCLMNLASMYGLDAADRFLDHFCAIAGTDFTYDPFWDLIVLIELLPEPPTVYSPWTHFGLRLSAALLQERNEAYLRSLMARLA